MADIVNKKCYFYDEGKVTGTDDGWIDDLRLTEGQTDYFRWIFLNHWSIPANEISNVFIWITLRPLTATTLKGEGPLGSKGDLK